MNQTSGDGCIVEGRLRERESSFPMIPVDEAIGQVLKEATPMEAATSKLADIPIGAVLRFHSRCAMVELVWCYCCSTTTVVFPCCTAAVNCVARCGSFG